MGACGGKEKQATESEANATEGTTATKASVENPGKGGSTEKGGEVKAGQQRGGPAGGTTMTSQIFPDAKVDLLQDFHVDKVLGQGAFGVVRLVTHKESRKQYACKSLAKARMISKQDVEDTQREVEILSIVKGHSNIVEFIDVYEDDQNVHIIMELCSGGELFDRILARGHYSEKDAADALRTMLEILDHCHQANVIHRDLKPENYLLDGPGDDAVLKLTDFGLSATLPKNEIATEIVGTPVYIAPEVLRGSYNEKADIWSCGCILYILLSGKLPFYGDNEKEELRSTLEGKYDLMKEPWPKVSEEAKDVVKRMLTMDVSQRPSAAELLQHPWVRENGSASSDQLDESIITGMRQVQQMNKLKKRALQVMANNLAKDDLDKMAQMFRAIDTDNSGSITVMELKQAIQKSGAKIPESELKDIMQTYDVDGDGTIDYSEFLLATSNLNRLHTMENIQHAFKQFDADGDGSITPEEVLEALKDCGVSMGSVLEMVKEADKDGDGRIQYNEFVEMMKDLEEMKNVTAGVKRVNLADLL